MKALKQKVLLKSFQCSSLRFDMLVSSWVAAQYCLRGHGALGALFLLLTRCTEAVVIDPAVVEAGKKGIRIKAK